jgi:hypothetical protein
MTPKAREMENAYRRAVGLAPRVLARDAAPDDDNEDYPAASETGDVPRGVHLYRLIMAFMKARCSPAEYAGFQEFLRQHGVISSKPDDPEEKQAASEPMTASDARLAMDAMPATMRANLGELYCLWREKCEKSFRANYPNAPRIDPYPSRRRC